MSVWRILEASMDRFSDEDRPETNSPLYNFMLQRFPSGEVPWPSVEKLLSKHGVPLPLSIGMPATEEAAEFGIKQGQPADVHKLMHFLGY